MNKMDTFDGYCEIKEKKYYFHFEEGLLTLLPNEELSSVDLFKSIFSQEEFEVSELHGVTSSNFKICFLNVHYTFSNGKYLSRPAGYILGTKNLVEVDLKHIDALTFKGEAINRFYIPIQSITFPNGNHNNEDGSMEIKLKPYSERTKEIVFSHQGRKVTFQLSIGNPLINNASRGSIIGNISSQVRLMFDSPIHIEDITAYFRGISHFFWFMNFRKNIQFDEIELARKINEGNNSGKYDIVGTMNITYKNSESSKVKDHRTIRYNEIEKYMPLFLATAFSDDFTTAHIPENDIVVRLIGKYEFLAVATSFESLFEKLYPEKLSATNALFSQTKKDVKKLIDKIKTENSSKDTSILDRLKSAISHQEFTLKEKIDIAMENYNPTLTDKIDQIISQSGRTRDDLPSIIKEFVTTRDQISHGSFDDISDNAIICFGIVRLFLYAMQLELIKVSRDDIKSIINKVF